MAKLNLAKLTATELASLENDLAAAKAARAQADVQSIREEVYKLLDKRGYTFGEVFGRAKGRKTGTVKPKYRNPKDSSETWTGRGRRPRWLEAEMKKGRSLKSFLIA